MMEFFPAGEEAAFQRRFAVAPGVSVYASIFRETFLERRWRRFRWNPFTNADDWDIFRDALEAALPCVFPSALFCVYTRSSRKRTLQLLSLPGGGDRGAERLLDSSAPSSSGVGKLSVATLLPGDTKRVGNDYFVV